MPITDTTEKRFEADIESFLVSAEGGYTKTTDRYDPQSGLYVNTLIAFESGNGLKKSTPASLSSSSSPPSTMPVK